MASNVFAGLGFDKDNFLNKVILIGEHNNCDSSFLIASLLWQGLHKSDSDSPSRVCMVSLHNTREHYENIAMKLGYNLGNHIKNGNVIFLDGFKIVNKYFSDEKHVKSNNINNSVEMSDEFLKGFYFNLKDNVDSFVKDSKNGNVYVIIDDLSDLLSLGFSLKSVITFVNYLRGLLSSIVGFTLIIGTHFNESDHEQCVLYKNLYRFADYCILVSGLKTGFSLDVSGSVNIVRKCSNPITGSREFKKDTYHFKLLDRQVKIFSPGTIQ